MPALEDTQMIEITQHDRKYWQYEYDVMAQHLLPLLRSWGVQLEGAAVLDVGCGDGGGLSAMADAGMHCVGFDIDPRRVELANALRGSRKFEMIPGDIHAKPPPFAGKTFDLVILHDVFEHLERKSDVLEILKSYLKPSGKLFITFPPYYSAFGAHQQLLRTRVARMPFLHLLPYALSGILPKLLNEHKPFVEEVQRLGKMKMGLAKFERLVEEAELHVIRRKLYLIGPNHIRFGLKPVGAGMLGKIPGVRELLTTGAVYLMQQREGVLRK